MRRVILMSLCVIPRSKDNFQWRKKKGKVGRISKFNCLPIRLFVTDAHPLRF